MLLVAALLVGLVAAAWNQTHFRPRRRDVTVAETAGEYVVVDQTRRWTWPEIAALVGASAACELLSVTQAPASTLFVFRCSQQQQQQQPNATSVMGISAEAAAALVVEPNHVVTVVGGTPGTQLGAQWDLGVLDCTAAPCNDGAYRYLSDTAAPIFIIDTGVRASHVDFGGRATAEANTIDGSGPDDCHGHGTHVTGLAIGTTHGVAKAGLVRMIKALDCNGQGSTFSVASAIAYVQDQCAAFSPPYPSALSMSLSGPASTTLDNAVSALQAACHISIVSAAGNQNDDACLYSPGRVSTSLTVGASTVIDTRASYSNYGACLDLLAPGGDAGPNPVVSDWWTSDVATQALSGTSMATPKVAAFAAQLQRQYMDTGYVLGSTNLGLVVNNAIKARLRNAAILYTYFAVNASAPPPVPPAPGPPAAPLTQPPPPNTNRQATEGIVFAPVTPLLAGLCLLTLSLA